MLIVMLLAATVAAYFYIRHVYKLNRKKIDQLNKTIVELKTDVYKNHEPHQKSTISNANALRLIEKLKELEKEELFLQPNYTLSRVAKKLKTNSSYLSETVNKYLNMSFAQYSNNLRIHCIAQKLLEQPQLRHYTIDALARESGYKSVTSFNYHFKKIFHKTPSNFLKELKELESKSFEDSCL